VQSVPTRGAQLSATALGDSTALRGFASITTGGLDVTLFFNDIHCGTGTPWATEAPHRVSRRVLPLLSQTALPLTVQMVLRDSSAPARLQQDSFLGYAPLMDARDSQQHFVIWKSSQRSLS
jgi:hypothetical protein